MPDRRELPYGSWPSPITIDMAVAASLILREPRLDGGDVYWTEGRPHEGGRQVIVRWNERDGAVDVTPQPFNARTTAHEYGGGWYAMDDGTVYFSNVPDGRIYRQERGAAPVAMTGEGPYRYGDLVVDRAHQRLLCIREDMSTKPEPSDALVAVDLGSGAVTVLAEGYDFYSTPRPEQNGQRLAWLSWRHPNMPWDTSELWVADVAEDGALRNQRQLAGGGEEAVVQPEWAPDGSLVLASDRSGWWNLYRWTEGGSELAALAPMEAEFAAPQWIFGLSWFGIAEDGTIVAAVDRPAGDELWMIPASGASAERIEVPDTSIDAVAIGGGRVVYLGASSTDPRAVVLLDVQRGQRRVLRRAFELEVDEANISRPQTISFPTTDGHTAHAFYYPPTNAAAVGPGDDRPPLVVMSHGGPTSQVTTALDLAKQVFTSRGFGVVDVNYRGSNGYGRAYMRLLDGKWGIYDVDDCVAAAQFLAERGQVDAARMAIRGGSAGGYTTLCALVWHDVFGAGASHYGVGDMEGLAKYTHKFESRYADRLVAPYPERADVYYDRSPIHFTDRINRPLIVFQGEDDKVVPVAQAEELVASLRERQIPHAYLLFAGEGHGFRMAENIKRSAEAELSFYSVVFGFELADPIEPVEVDFLPRR